MQTAISFFFSTELICSQLPPVMNRKQLRGRPSEALRLPAPREQDHEDSRLCLPGQYSVYFFPNFSLQRYKKHYYKLSFFSLIDLSTL
jgi:hypothetical protein